MYVVILFSYWVERHELFIKYQNNTTKQQRLSIPFLKMDKTVVTGLFRESIDSIVCDLCILSKQYKKKRRKVGGNFYEQKWQRLLH